MFIDCRKKGCKLYCENKEGNRNIGKMFKTFYYIYTDKIQNNFTILIA